MNKDRFPDGAEAAFDRVNEFSDRALYPYLQIGILGPYSGDCHAYLNTIRLALQEKGFEQVALASDRDKEPPEEYEGREDEFWLEDSIEFLKGCDATIFIFLTNELQRSYLPDKAFESDPTDRTDHPQGLNGSIIVELEKWVNLTASPEDRTLIIYEEGCYRETGSLVSGEVNYNGLDDDVIDSHDVEAAISRARMKCVNWVMGEFKSVLQDRYRSDMYDI